LTSLEKEEKKKKSFIFVATTFERNFLFSFVLGLWLERIGRSVMNWKKGKKKRKINGISALKDQTCKEIERKRLNSLYIAIHVKPRHRSNPMLLLEKKKQHKDLVLFFPKWEFWAEKTNGSLLSLSHRLNRERRKQEEKKGF
jgi:hypothetical protein